MGNETAWKKQQRIFFKMTPKQLARYVKAHPTDPASKSVVNARFKTAIQVLTKTSNALSNNSRVSLAIWTKNAFTTPNTIVSPKYLQQLYTPCVNSESASQLYKLQSAIMDFVTFAGSPVVENAQTDLRLFIEHLLPTTQKSTESASQAKNNLAQDMDAYKKATSLFPHSF